MFLLLSLTFDVENTLIPIFQPSPYSRNTGVKIEWYLLLLELSSVCSVHVCEYRQLTDNE